MVLKDDKIGQACLLPLDVRELIPKDHPCYFVQNVVESMEFSKVESKYVETAGKHAYSRKMLLRIVLMGVFDGILSGRELESRVATDVVYMYLAGMDKPNFRTINRFKKEEKELIKESFKKSVEIADEYGLVKIKHIAIDGTKIKAKASLNNLSNKQQLKYLKKVLEASIKKDEEEDELLGDQSGNTVPKELVDKEEFKKIYQKVIEKTEGDRNEFKLRRSSKKLLQRAFKNKTSKKAVLKEINHMLDELEKTKQDVISIGDPESRFMKNKKGSWEFDYNLQIAVDDYKGIIVSTDLTQNPTDHYELIPQIEQINETIGQINHKTQITADNGYLTDENTDYLEENKLDGYISSRKLSRKLKKLNKKDKPFAKDKFNYDYKLEAYICPAGEIMKKTGTYKPKDKTLRTCYNTPKCYKCQFRSQCCNNNSTRTISDYGNPSNIKMKHKMETPEAQKIYQKRAKTVEWAFGNIKQNKRYNEFYATGLERNKTEAYLLATSHNLKRIYNEITKNELIHQENNKNN